MNKSGLYINGNKVCDIHKYSIIRIIPQSLNLNRNEHLTSFLQNSFYYYAGVANNIKCQVVGVSDGDTFSCLTNDNTQLKNIDAPETKQDFSQVSKKALSDLTYNKSVTPVRTFLRSGLTVL